MQRSVFWIILMFCVFFALQGCTQNEELSQKSEPGIEKEWVGVIEQLTAIMQAQYHDPSQNLEELRAYVAKNQSQVSSLVNELNRDYLAMDESSRKKWRSEAKSVVQTSLDKYAQAQLRLSQRLNDAQKWELGEVLSQLK